MIRVTGVPADYYDQGIKNNLGQRWWHKQRFKLIKAMLPKIESQVLDVGCNSGTFTEEIGKALPKAKITGVDVDTEAVAYAKKHRPGFKFIVAGAEKLPFKKDSFDLAVCLEVMEHVKDPVKVLKEMKRCLKPGGWLVVLVPSESWLFRVIWFFWTKGKGRVWQEAHLHDFNGHRLDKLMKKVGFKIEERRLSHLGMLLAVRARRGL